MGFLCFAKNVGKNTGKNISKNLSSKYSQKLLDHPRQYATDAFKTTSKRATQITAEANDDLNGYKIAIKIAKVWKKSQQNNSETFTNRHDKEIPKERYISPEERQRIIDDLRII